MEVSQYYLNTYENQFNEVFPLHSYIYKPLNMKDTMFTTTDRLDHRIATTSWGNRFEYKMIDDPNFGYYVEEDADDFKNWRNYT